MKWSTRKLDEPQRLAEDQPTLFLSDLHLCDGSGADDSVVATEALLRVLDVPKDRSQTNLILVGDVIEGWQVSGAKGLADIFSYNRRIFDELFEFKHVYWVLGNHDRCMGKESAQQRLTHCIPKALEKVTIAGERSAGAFPEYIFVAHGHQADIWNSDLRFIGKLATGIWGVMERLFPNGKEEPHPTDKELTYDGPKEHVARNSSIEPYLEYMHDHMVEHGMGVFGHTHRPAIYGSIINIGCIVGPDVTKYGGLLLEDGEIWFLECR